MCVSGCQSGVFLVSVSRVDKVTANYTLYFWLSFIEPHKHIC